jgi:hypothetical protein
MYLSNGREGMVYAFVSLAGEQHSVVDRYSVFGINDHVLRLCTLTFGKPQGTLLFWQVVSYPKGLSVTPVLPPNNKRAFLERRHRSPPQAVG